MQFAKDVGGMNLKYFLLCLVLTLTSLSCAMTAKNHDTGETLSLKGLGSGEAEFPSGGKIKKGLFQWPDFTVKQ